MTEVAATRGAQLRRRRSLRAGQTQLLYIAAGVGLGLLVPTLDTGARIPAVEVAALLAGITAGLLALTGIVFALLFLVVQFAATAQSPRLHLFRDKPLVWHALGLVIGVMVYATTCVVAQNPLGARPADLDRVARDCHWRFGGSQKGLAVQAVDDGASSGGDLVQSCCQVH